MQIKVGIYVHDDADLVDGDIMVLGVIFISVVVEVY